MHPIINHLIQLQELCLIRDEQKAYKRMEQLSMLDASIESLAAQLPAEARQLYEKLHKRNPVVIVPVSNGGCAGCGMKLPISLVQTVRASQSMQHCPTCVRILYYPEAPVRRTVRAARRTEPQKIGITRFSSHTLMIPKLLATTRDEAVLELATVMQAEGFVDSPDRLVELALRREAIVSTAFEHGLAFPHVRGVEGGGLTLALGVSHKGIRFEESSKNLTRLIFFMVIPTAASAFYLKLIAGLAETFADAESRKKVMSEDDPEKMWKALVKVTRSTVP